MPVCIGITDKGGQTGKKKPYWCVGKNESEYVCGATTEGECRQLLFRSFPGRVEGNGRSRLERDQGTCLDWLELFRRVGELSGWRTKGAL